MGPHVGAVENFNLPVEWQSSDRAWRRTRAVAVKRLDVNGPVPASANDLSQSLCVILIRLIDLHLETSARMPGIEANDFEPEIAEFMHKPRRHRSSLSDGANYRMSTQCQGL